MSDLEFRAASDEDLPGILETMRLALGESPLLRRTPDLWNWKHSVNPFGRSIALVAVSREGTIAGVRALMRWEIHHGGETILCARPVDTATHPAFTRQGIFRSLTANALEVARELGIRLVFNTPNDKSAPGYLKMGWQHVGWIGGQVRPRLGRAVTPDAAERPSITKLAPDALPPSAIPTRRIPGSDPQALHTLRNPTYINWRFVQHPYASYGWVPGRSDNGLVVRASERGGRSELVAADLLGSPEPSPLAAAARMSRARYMAGWFSPRSPKRRAAIRGGLLPVPGLRALRLVALQLAELPRDPFDLGSWDLSTSDLELL